jgi:hypothetical protein
MGAQVPPSDTQARDGSPKAVSLEHAADSRVPGSARRGRQQAGHGPRHPPGRGPAARVVAVLDNDTAAAEALRTHGRSSLSDRIRVVQYPPLGLGCQYPTLGPPTVHSPSGSIELADVNGLAASIELYLGRDVLTAGDGSLRPVQWTSFNAGMRRYHGEVTGKHDTHEAFRAKAAAAPGDRTAASAQDWEGLRLILDAILTVFHERDPNAESAASPKAV